MKPLTYKLLLPLVFAFVFLQVSSDTLYGQMFSVDEGPEFERPMFRYTTLSTGWETGDFSFTGDPEQAGLNRFDFNDGIFKILFENPGIDMYFGIAGNLTGSENRNLLNIGATIYNDFPLAGTERVSLILPLQLNTDLMRVQAATATNRFQQSSFHLGAGLGARASISERLNSTLQLIPNYGFSNSQGAFIGGTVFTLHGKARIYLDDLIGSHGIVAGYDYRYRSYHIDADLFNYNYNSHSITLGFIF